MRPLLLLRAVAWLKRLARSNERLAIAQERIAVVEEARWFKETKIGRKPAHAQIDVVDEVAVESNWRRDLRERDGMLEDEV